MTHKRKTLQHHEVALIKADVTVLLVSGEFGYLPVNGKRGKRTPDGGIHKRINNYTDKKYNHKLGGGTKTNLIKYAAKIQKRQKQKIVKPVTAKPVIDKKIAIVRQPSTNNSVPSLNANVVDKLSWLVEHGHMSLISEKRKTTIEGMLKQKLNKGWMSPKQTQMALDVFKEARMDWLMDDCV